MSGTVSTRTWTIRDFEEWEDKGELVLQPKFQRRVVWETKARSFLMDTIVRGKPIPKIFLRQEVNIETRRVTREVVDGQQRLRTILQYLSDGFPILKVHNSEYGGKFFSELDENAKRRILKYELAVDVLEDMPDSEIYDMFARLNTYSMVLNAQEQRNGHYFGEFKSSVYLLSNEFQSFFVDNRIFSSQQILRMQEAEFISELLIAISVGIRARDRAFIDKFYLDNDDSFPLREVKEERFRDTMDAIGEILSEINILSKLREARFIYPLFCSIYHMQYGLPEFEINVKQINPEDYPKIRTALEQIEQIFNKIKRGKQEEKLWKEKKEKLDDETEDGSDPLYDTYNEDVEDEILSDVNIAEEEDPYMGGEEVVNLTEVFNPLYLLTPSELRFQDAYNIRWVHAAKRKTLTEHICNLITNTVNQ